MSEFNSGIQIINPNDRGLPDDLRFSAMSTKTLAHELDKFLMRHIELWKLNGEEQGLIGEAANRLRLYS